MFLLLNISLFPGHLVELTSTEKITELQQYLMTRYSNKSFWVGSSDLENEGTFRWFYSGDLFSSDLWSRKPRDDNHCVRMDDSFLKFSADECVNKNYFICEVGPNLLGQGYQIFVQYTPEIYVPIDDNSVSAEGRARSFDTLNPRSHYNDICGRKFVDTGRTGRIVGGGVANYAEWPWQVRTQTESILAQGEPS